MDNIIKAFLHNKTVCKTAPVFQYNQGMELQIVGYELPESYRADFSNSETGTSKPVFGSGDTVSVPYEYFVPGATIHCWIVFSGAEYTVTKLHIMIPVDRRATPTNEEPTPEQQSALDEAIAAINDAAEAVPEAINSALEAAKESGEFDGKDGVSPTVSVVPISGGHRITITDESGSQTVDVMDGEQGENGRGILSVQKTGIDGLVDTYTITYTDGTTTTFTVTNGKNGIDGADGTTFTPSVSEQGVITWTNDGGKANPQPVDIKGPPGDDGTSPTVSVVDITGGHRVTITDAIGTRSFDVMDGPQGDPGDDYVLTAADKAEIAQMAATIDNKVTVSGTTPTINAQAGIRYICGEVATITINPPASGCIDVIFESGSTASVLTVPNTVKWPEWFDPTSLEANATYEINVLDGSLGAVGIWM